jgi:hypothetical protein
MIAVMKLSFGFKQFKPFKPFEPSEALERIEPFFTSILRWSTASLSV